MPRCAWLTDLHLDMVRAEALERFFDGLQAGQPDVVLISGDIAEATHLTERLAELDERLARPIFFVLGNHDFYFGSIAEVRAAVSALCERRPRLHYLSTSGPVALGATTGLVGHDGWADGRIGDYERSFVMMNDYRLIQELAAYGKRERLSQLHALGDEAAAHIARQLPVALEQFEHVYLVTHVPPLREACWHQGALSDDEWAPHFTCQAMGDVILSTMDRYPARQLTVLCGHTHSPGRAQPRPNVVIHTGGARYGQPEIAAMLGIP